jgi:hypothetical protein
MSKGGIAMLFLFLAKIDRIPYFDIHYSIFDIRFFRVSFSIRLTAFQASGDARMKLHEIQCHFHEVPHSVTEYRRQMTEVR